MEAIAVPHGVNKPTNNQLRFGVLRPDRRHDFASVQVSSPLRLRALCVALNVQYATTDKLSNRWDYRIANESPSSTVQPSGKPISFSHSFQVKFLAT
jgi:hypothetical protein